MERGLGCRIIRASGLSGGCIAHATHVETDAGPVFLKWMDDEMESLKAEAVGLNSLAAATTDLIIPRVLHHGRGEGGSLSVLVLEWLVSGATTAESWSRLGEGLAALHRVASDQYGFDTDNFIGRLPQSNLWSQEWPNFFLERRLIPQIDRARRNGSWRSVWDAAFHHLAGIMNDLLPATPAASLLHGDLWIGNVMMTHDGTPALVDPAVYFGHAETDLAMTRLFGGFDRRFYNAYEWASPPESGWEERCNAYELYHIINHLNHFGEAYASGVARRLERYR